MTDNFPPIFVINLKHSTERRATMTERLNQLGLNYSFIEAVNGSELNLKTLPFYDGMRRRLLFGRDMSKGELGCLLSHRAIYQEIVDRNLEKAIILEDDVIIAPAFPAVVQALLKVPVKWDMVRFLDSEKIYRRSRTIGSLLESYALIRPAISSGGAHAYMITQNTARQLLKHTQKNFLPIDILHSYVWRTGLEVFAVRPSPAVRDEVITSTIDLEGTRFNKKLQITGWPKIIYPVTHFWLKLSEYIGKRSSYWLAWPRDINNKQALKQ